MLTVADLPAQALQNLLEPYSILIKYVANNEPIPGSFWGNSEAGLIKNELYVRPETPVHSALHEACHYICLDSARRNALHTDAGGDYDEENAVCYLQILLAAKLSGCSADTLMKNMDSWGYTFRLGSALAWFRDDAEDAQHWLLKEQLIDQNNTPTWRLRP
ncbi:MAG: hypothetical protein BMS9Abin31_0606 [Gammaproteobacteria bacterium]|nr:MAG: hypothetical protein BMS9Abin31_0606 [Gammaproteobacteria bacterium]